MKTLSLILAFGLISASARAENHNFVLFGTSQNTYGIHLSMDMPIHRYQTVAQFQFDGSDAQSRLVADRASHPGRNYLLNPIEATSKNDLYFELADFASGQKFDASIYYCDTPVIWNTCFDTWKILIDRSHVTVGQVYANTQLVAGTAPYSPARYRMIGDAEAMFAFPLMTDLPKQFDQVLSVKAEGAAKTAMTEVIVPSGTATRLRAGDAVKAADGAAAFSVQSELLFIDNMP